MMAGQANEVDQEQPVVAELELSEKEYDPKDTQTNDVSRVLDSLCKRQSRMSSLEMLSPKTSSGRVGCRISSG